MKEVLDIFDPQPGQIYIDATINGGGHALAIAERILPGGKLLGIDWDSELIERLRIKNQESGIKNIELSCGNYVDIREIAERNNIISVNGILFDLGFSSFHIEGSGRGFTFAKDEPLDMRYSPVQNELTAAKVVNQWPEEALVEMIFRFGEERFAKRIARAIIQRRQDKKILTTRELADIVRRAAPPAYRSVRLHPATRTFQALRIAVNKELETLERVLPDAASLLSPAGKIVIISFHSLEDRIVKTFMREEHKNATIRILTPKPIRPTPDEIHANPRARSARLRAAIKL